MLLCDESTDTANLIIFTTFLVKGSSLCNSFLTVISIQMARKLPWRQSLSCVCEKWGIPIAKIYGFGSDGVAIMVGCKEGVATCLKILNPKLLSVHCGAHRLSLAASQAANSVSYLQKLTVT